MYAVITAVSAEREAVARALGDEVRAQRIGPYDGRITDDVVVVAGGVGPAAAAAAAATVVAHLPVDCLVSMGVAGAFPSARLSLGDVVLATTMVAADLGAMSPERFLDLSAIGLDGGAATTCDLAWVAAARERLVAAGLHVALGPVLTLSTATGTAERAAELMAQHGALAEAMEGAGVAHVSVLHDLPCAEVRTVSNEVGDRDRDAWDLPGALTALTAATRAVFAR